MDFGLTRFLIRNVLRIFVSIIYIYFLTLNYRAGLAVLPHNAKMHYNFGNFLRDSSKPDLATLHYKEALR